MPPEIPSLNEGVPLVSPTPVTSFDKKGFAFTLKVAFAIVVVFYSAKLGVHFAKVVVAHSKNNQKIAVAVSKTPSASATPQSNSATSEQDQIQDASSINLASEIERTQQTLADTIVNPAVEHLTSAPITEPTPPIAQAQAQTIPSTPLATPQPIVASLAEVPRINISTTIAAADKAIVANLDTMTVDLYVKGLRTKTLPIASKGRPNSHWETPSGMYEILTKERNHFSSIGEVNMPYSMQFYGNFFIHGWPTYKDGTPVPQNYSGGCIRLLTEDAAQIFAFANVHTPLIVIDKSDAKAFAEVTGTIKNNVGIATTEPASTPSNIAVKKSIIQSLGKLPSLSAKAYLVADIDSGEIITSSNADTKLPIASLTKLMTAVVSNEVIRYDALIKVTPEALATYGESGGLVLDEKINATDMLYPLLMESSNDASEALARSYGRQTFISQMNKKAAALGMTNTTYDDPSGISAANQSSAYDLFSLARYLYEKKQFLLSITRTPTRKLATSATTHALRNFNVFSGDSAFLGGKTGFTTAAQETMIALFNVETSIGERPVAIIVLGSKDRAHDTSSLLSWTREAIKKPDAFASGAALGASVSDAQIIDDIQNEDASSQGSGEIDIVR